MNYNCTEKKALKILVLDGGDARSMSELFLLHEFMSRVEAITGKIRPCEHFDLIVGVDAAGFIAILLGVFGMTAENAMEEYAKAYKAIFDVHTPEQRGLVLEETVRDLLRRTNASFGERTTLRECRLGGECKVAICYASSANLKSCQMFRSYRSSSQPYEPTIIEAIRASWATPGLIAPVKVGRPPFEVEAVSVLYGFSNPIQEAVSEAYNCFGADRFVSCLLSLGSGKRGSIALGEDGKAGIEALSLDPEGIAEEMQRRVGTLGPYHRFSVDSGLEGHGRFPVNFGLIKSHTGTYLSREVVSSRLQDCVKRSTMPSVVTLDRIYHSRAQEGTLSHSLPPLSTFFVMRRQPMEALVNGLLDYDNSMQRVMLLSGLGGKGKTQLALKFARDYGTFDKDRGYSFRHILFIDASSKESLERGMIARVRSLDPNCGEYTIEGVLGVLANTSEALTKDWLIILDNADDPELDLTRYIPSCDHGAILITSRNPLLENIATNAHYELGTMSPEEATEALMKSIFLPRSMTSFMDNTAQNEGNPGLSSRERETIALIAERLGYLPIALIQAGCYIRQTKCLLEYLDRLENNRSAMLERATPLQRDRLRYKHSPYAAFDITLQVLSTRAHSLMAVLSFFRFVGFPRPLFSIAAASQFRYDPFDLMDRPAAFEEDAKFLTSILCPKGTWKEDELDDLLQELQQYSLVSLVQMNAIVTFRFHPLTHGWAQDRMTSDDRLVHNAAAIRLLVCGTSEDNEHIFEYLAPHIATVTRQFDSLHVNDRAAISQVMRSEKQHDGLLKTWKGVHTDVERVYGANHLRTTRAALSLADAYGENSYPEKMEEIEREVVATRGGMFGTDHAETLLARSNLGRTLYRATRYEEAETIQKDILRSRIQSLGMEHKDTALALEDLSVTLHDQAKYSEEQALMMGVVEIRTKVSGRSHISTISSLEALAVCHQCQGHIAEAETLVNEVVELRRLVYGDEHLAIDGTLAWLARRYHEQERYSEAEELRRREVEIWKKMQGNLERYAEAEGLSRHDVEIMKKTRDKGAFAMLHGMFWLGHALFSQGKFVEAVDLWKIVLQGMRTTSGSLDVNTLSAMDWLARAYFAIGNRRLAVEHWEEALAGRKDALGNQHPNTLQTMHYLARAYTATDLHEEAEALHREVYEIRRDTLGPRAKGTINAAYYLGQAFYSHGDLEYAETWTVKALELMKEEKDTSDADMLGTMHALSLIYAYLGRPDDAAKSWKARLKTRSDSFDDKNAKTLSAMHSLARKLRELGKYKAAETLLTEELEHRRALQGAKEILTLDALDELVQTQYSQGHYGIAEISAKEAIELRKEVTEDDQVKFWEAMHKLALIYASQQKHDEAAEIWWKILGTTSTDPTPFSLEVMANLILAYDRQGLDSEASIMREMELEGRIKLYGEQNPRTLDALHQYGHDYYSQGRYPEATRLWKEEMKIRMELSKTDPATLDLMQWLAGALYQQNKYAEAEEVLRDEVAIRRKMSTAVDNSTLRAIHWCAQCCFREGKYLDAVELWRDELEGRRHLAEDSQGEIQNILQNIAEGYIHLELYAEAHVAAKEALEIHRSAVTEDSPILLETARLLDAIESKLASGGPASPVPDHDSIDEENPSPVSIQDPSIHQAQTSARSLSASPWTSTRPVATTRQLNSWSMFF